MNRKTKVVVLTLMGTSTIAYFAPGCDRDDRPNSQQPTTRSSSSGAHYYGGGGAFVGHSTGARSGVQSPSKSGVTRGGFGSSSSSSFSSGT